MNATRRRALTVVIGGLTLAFAALALFGPAHASPAYPRTVTVTWAYAPDRAHQTFVAEADAPGPACGTYQIDRYRLHDVDDRALLDQLEAGGLTPPADSSIYRSSRTVTVTDCEAPPSSPSTSTSTSTVSTPPSSTPSTSSTSTAPASTTPSTSTAPPSSNTTPPSSAPSTVPSRSTSSWPSGSPPSSSLPPSSSATVPVPSSPSSSPPATSKTSRGVTPPVATVTLPAARPPATTPTVRSLASTGADADSLIPVGVAAVGLGVAATLIGRRRRGDHR